MDGSDQPETLPADAVDGTELNLDNVTAPSTPTAYSGETSSQPVIEYDAAAVSRRRVAGLAVALIVGGSAIATVVYLMGRPSAGSNSLPMKSSTTSAVSAIYNGAAYANQVQNAILRSFANPDYPLAAFDAACGPPYPVDWVCAIAAIRSPKEGWIDVTLVPNWDEVLTEWSGPPAGVGCFKWGEQIGRNIQNFTKASHVQPPTRVSVYKSDGTFC